MYIISNEIINDDNEVLWRHNMFSNIVYAYTYESAMLNRFRLTLLSKNKLLSKRIS